MVSNSKGSGLTLPVGRLLGSIIVATIDAVLLIFIIRLIKRA